MSTLQLLLTLSGEIIDGVNQWDAIRTGGESPRTEFVYNIDEFQPLMCGHAAIR